jgi:hypothetical protein
MEYIKWLKENYAGLVGRLSERELRIFDMMKYVSNSQATHDRDQAIANFKRGLGAHLAASSVLTNSKITNGSQILGLELREVENLIIKLEMWELMYVPKFQIPFYSMKIYGEAENNEWEFFGEPQKANFRNIKKGKINLEFVN